MMEFILHKLNKDTVIYKYSPESDGQYGLVEFNLHTGKWKYLKRHTKDFSIYTGMIASAAAKLFKSKEYPDNFVVACW